MITLKDLPGDILAVITSADNLDQSTRYTAARACKLLTGIIGRNRVSICDVAADGHLAILKWYATETHCAPSAEAVVRAAASGHLHIIEYLRQAGCPWDDNTVSAAAAGGHLDVFAYAVENGCDYTPYAFKMAAVNGRVNILQYAYDNNIDTKCNRSIVVPMMHGYVRLECACRQFRDLNNIKYMCRKAANAGNIEVIAWFTRDGYMGLGEDISHGIVKHCHIVVLEWLIHRGVRLHYKWYIDAFLLSAPIKLFDWLFDHDCPKWDGLRNIVAHIRPDIIEWCDRRGY